MDLEKLRILIEASTGDSATQVGRLNKVLEQHAGALKLAERAAQAAERAEKLHAAGVSQASAAVLKAAREQQQATNARISAGKTVLATMNRAAQAEARAVINRKGLNKALAETIAMSARADAVFAKVDRTLAQGATTAQGAAKGQKSIGDAFFGAMQKAFFFMSAVDRVRGALTKLYGAAENAARTNTAKMYFEEAGKSLERLRAVSKGLVSDADLVKRANLADSMGLSSGVFENLIRVAQAASAKTGQSFDHMFDSIVLGTARSSRLLLDNLGIIVNVKEANRAYAQEAIKNGEAHGKTVQQVVEAMTAEAKQAAFLQAMYKATAGQLKELDQIGQGGASAFDKWAASVDNLKLALMSTLLPAIEWILGKLTDVADAVTKGVKAKGLDMDPRVLRSENPASGKVEYSVAGEFFGEDSVQALDAMQDRLKDLTVQLRMRTGGEIRLETLLNERGTALSEQTNEYLDSLGDAGTELGQLALTVSSLQGILKTLARPKASTKSGGLDFEKRAGKAYGLSDDAFAEGLKDAERMMDEADQRLWDFFRDLKKTALALAEASAEARRSGLAALHAARDWAPGGELIAGERPARDWEADAQRLDAEGERQRGQVASGIDMAATATSGDTGAVVQLIGSLIGAAAGAPEIGSAIGGLLAPFLEEMGGLTDVVMGLFNGVSLLLTHAFSPLLNTLAPLGPALEDLLAAVGILIGAAIDPFLIVFQFLVPLIALAVDFVTMLVVALSPLVAVVIEVVLIFSSLLGPLLLLLEHFTGFSMGADGVVVFTELMRRAGDTLVNAAIKFNNVIVDFVRGLGSLLKSDRLKEWGDKLSWDDFEVEVPEDDPTPDNTEAVMENTRAVRDLAREFHNLPSGYKGNAAVYAATDPREPRFRQPFAGRDLSGLQQGPASRLFNPYRG